MMTWVQILDKAVDISHNANSLGKGTILDYSPSCYGYIVGQTELFNLGMATGLGEEKLWILTCYRSVAGDLLQTPVTEKLHTWTCV